MPPVGKRFHDTFVGAQSRILTREIAMSKFRVANGLLFVALSGILLASSPLLAQFHSAIEGTVTDSTGAAVPGAQVILTNQDTGVSQTSVTNDTRAYHFPSIGLGKYSLTATKSGFQTVKQENIALAAEETRTIPLTLKVGTVAETITITEDAAAVQLAESKIASGIGSQEITELPLTGRNIFNLVSMTPGVTGIGQASGGAFDNNVFSLVNGGQTNANGQRGDARPERAARHHAHGRGSRNALAAVRAGAAVKVDARHHRLDLRQIDVIVGIHLRLIARRGGFSAFRASIRKYFPHMVRLLGQFTRYTGPAFTLLFGLLRAVCLPTLRRRQR